MFLISLEMFLKCEGRSSHFRTFLQNYAWPFQENKPLFSKDITISTWAGLWSCLFCFHLSPVFYQISFLMCLIQSTCFMKTEKHGLIYSINSNLIQNSASHPVGGRRGISQRRKVLKMNRYPRYVCQILQPPRHLWSALAGGPEGKNAFNSIAANGIDTEQCYRKEDWKVFKIRNGIFKAWYVQFPAHQLWQCSFENQHFTSIDFQADTTFIKLEIYF